MKIAVLSDIHFGVRSNSRVFLDHFLEFFREGVVKRSNLLGVRHLIIAGDLFDHRKLTSTDVLHELKIRFWPEVWGQFNHVYILPGNHDVYHTNTLRVNALETLVPSPPTPIGNKLDLVMEPEVFEFDNLNILMVPWICEENEEECLDAIRIHARNSNTSHVIGHFHLKGFNIGTGQVAEDGHDGNIFDGYEEVASGHFHTLSEQKVGRHKGTIVRYLSCPYEMTWSDWNDPKGFHLLDTEDGKYTFYRNPKRLFNKILWTAPEDLQSEVGQYAGTYCRVIRDPRASPERFNTFIEDLEKVALDVKVVEQTTQVLSSKEETTLEIADTDDVWTHLKTCIKETTTVDQGKLEALFGELYKEALLRQA